jgi:uncharacterized protein YjbI with pentapeptide repeats
MFKKLSLALLLFVLTTNTSCANGINQQKDISISKEKSLTIKGKVVFPNGFKTKAENTSTLSSVSIIYPANDPTNPNKTIATGITNDSGYFSINTSSTFIPQNNQIFVVEAIKRFNEGYYNSTNGNIQSLRSFIRWNGSNWDSITSNDLVIDTMTTGVSILSSYTNTNPNDTIGKISNGTASVIGNISLESINRLSDMVRVCLNEKRDPYASIKLIDNNYYIDRNYDVGKLLTSDDLTGLTLSYTNLAGANLSGKNLSNMDLTGINLSGADLFFANLSNCNFTNANLSYVGLYSSTLAGSTIYNTNLSYVDFRNTSLTNVNIDKTNLSHSVLHNFIFEGDFTNTDLSYADLFHTTFVNNNIFDVNLKGASFYKADLGSLDLTGRDLSKCNFDQANLENVILKNTNLSEANLINQKLANKDFTGTNFDGADLSNASMRNTILNSTSFKGTNLTNIYFRGVNLSGIDLSNANLYDANLYEVNFTNAILTGANLSKAKWSDGRICKEDSIGQCN